MRLQTYASMNDDRPSPAATFSAVFWIDFIRSIAHLYCSLTRWIKWQNGPLIIFPQEGTGAEKGARAADGCQGPVPAVL